MEPDNVILHEYKIVFMCVAKIATTSIKTALFKSIGIKNLKGLHVHKEINWQDKEYIIKNCQDHYIAAFVRNPYDRLVSCWLDKVEKKLHPKLKQFGIKQGMTFEQFARIISRVPDSKANQHFRSQFYELTYDHNGMKKIIPNFIGRFERIDFFWKILQYQLSGMLKIIDLPKLNSKKRKTYFHYYTPEIKEIVRNRYLNDLLRFGYEF